MDTAWLFLSSLFSLIGMAVFVYGKRQRQGAPMIIGVALMVYTYFIDDTVIMVVIGLLLLVGLVVGSRMENNF